MPDGFLQSLSGFVSECSATLKSSVKLLLASRRATIGRSAEYRRPLIALGNGPSLKENLLNDMDTLREHPALAVNFFANSPEFSIVRPRYYVLADPHFFTGGDSDENVSRLAANIRSASWTMILFIPASFRRHAAAFNGSKIEIRFFNAVAMEGFRWFEHLAWSRNLGMPRPRNVLIPSLMIGLSLGFKTIYLLGADHSWTRTLYVTDDNTVVSVQPHFYADSAGEKERVSSVYAGVRLHQVMESMVIAFRSYHDIRRYAAHIGAQIFNATPGSMIDAFTRQQLPPAQS